jgi:hypothetical protein
MKVFTAIPVHMTEETDPVPEMLYFIKEIKMVGNVQLSESY